jgi:hypothetical protein
MSRQNPVGHLRSLARVSVNQPASGDGHGADMEPQFTTRELWDNALRFGLPRFPRWVKYFSLAITGVPIGLIALIGGATMGVTGATVTGSVFLCLALSALVAGTRIRRRDQAASAVPPAHPQRVRPKRRGP